MSLYLFIEHGGVLISLYLFLEHGGSRIWIYAVIAASAAFVIFVVVAVYTVW